MFSFHTIDHQSIYSRLMEDQSMTNYLA